MLYCNLWLQTYKNQRGGIYHMDKDKDKDKDNQTKVMADLQPKFVLLRGDTNEIYDGPFTCKHCTGLMVPIYGDHTADGILDLRCVACDKSTGVATLIGHLHPGEHCAKRVCG